MGEGPWPSMFGGLRIIVVEGFTGRHEVHWRKLPLGQIPPGTSQRTHSRGRQWVVGQRVWTWDDPGDQALRTGDTIFCTPKQYAALKTDARLVDESATPQQRGRG